MKTDIEKTDKRSLRSRKWLLDALLELIKERPFSDISVSEITDNADISRQTFYLHYYNKRDLLNELLDREFLQFREALLAKARIEAFNPIKISDHIFSFWSENTDSLHPLLSADADNRLMKKLRELTSEIVGIYIQQNDQDVEAKAAYVADFLSGGAFALLQRWINNTEEISPHELAEIVGTAADAIRSLVED